jgi:hypothetical protein
MSSSDADPYHRDQFMHKDEYGRNNDEEYYREKYYKQKPWEKGLVITAVKKQAPVEERSDSYYSEDYREEQREQQVPVYKTVSKKTYKEDRKPIKEVVDYYDSSLESEDLYEEQR